MKTRIIYMRRLETLSKKQRAATPPAFARYLADRLKELFSCERVAVLWVDRGSVYKQMKDCDCWDVQRDANLYSGPGPIIAHPPCGPWGKYRARCHQSKDDGIQAMRLVHRFGGVVEQPRGSSLFYQHGGHSLIQHLDQSSFGHAAKKATLLYWIGPDQVENTSQAR